MPPNPNLGDFPFEEANRHLVEAAIRNEAVLAKSVREMRELEHLLGERVRGLPDWIATEVDRRLAEAVRRTAGEVTKRLSEANDAATRAHAAYDRAANVAMWNISRIALAFFFIACISMIAGVYVSAKVILPTPSVLERLREAEQTLATLLPQGGNSQLNQCSETNKSSRLCIRTDEREPDAWKGNHGETYRVIYGY